MEIRELFDNLEKEIIKQHYYHRCPDYCKDCVQCKFWKKFDKMRKDILELESAVKGTEAKA